jgi:hypothetical protein
MVFVRILPFSARFGQRTFDRYKLALIGEIFDRNFFGVCSRENGRVKWLRLRA